MGPQEGELTHQPQISQQLSSTWQKDRWSPLWNARPVGGIMLRAAAGLLVVGGLENWHSTRIEEPLTSRAGTVHNWAARRPFNNATKCFDKGLVGVETMRKSLDIELVVSICTQQLSGTTKRAGTARQLNQNSTQGLNITHEREPRVSARLRSPLNNSQKEAKSSFYSLEKPWVNREKIPCNSWTFLFFEWLV
jgi:hypothetical protein